MEIIKIGSQNLEDHLEDLILLNDEFEVQLGSTAIRSFEEKSKILKLMVLEPSTEMLIVYNGEGCPVGSSYYNYGSGYSCGGRYLWLNGIYIREKYQKNGYGTKLLGHIEAIGRSKGIKLFICSRHNENDGSRRLFAKSSFEQESQMIMTKELNICQQNAALNSDPLRDSS